MAAATASREVLEPLLGTQTDKAAAAASTCILADGVQQADEQAAKKVQWKLTVALLLCFAFMILEFVGGILANSLAIMTDAAHLLSDVSGFGVSLFAAWYAARKSQTTHTFGYHRVEVLGALASVLSIWLVTGILVYEAVDRVKNPVRVNGKVMFFLALAGCAVNLINLFVLDSHVGHSHGPGEDHGCGGHGHSHSHGAEANGHVHSHEQEHDEEAALPVSLAAGGSSYSSSIEGHSHSGHSHGHSGHSHSGHDHSGHDHSHSHSHGGEYGHEGGGSGGGNINMRGAVLHIIGDLVQSIGVAAAGALIWWKQDDPRFQIADPICTFIFALLVLWTTRVILQDISDILMERVPRHLDVSSIETKLMQVPGVQSVFDLHVWALKPSIPLLAAHVTVQSDADPGRVLADVTTSCRTMGITHTTIQICDEGHGEGCQTRLPPALAA